MLFPAKISDDSPWKQETASSILDPDTENRTQEAIDLYFSRHHKITSPEDSTLPLRGDAMIPNDRGGSTSMHSRSVTTEDLGGSPDLKGGNCSNEIQQTPNQSDNQPVPSKG